MFKKAILCLLMLIILSTSFFNDVNAATNVIDINGYYLKIVEDIGGGSQIGTYPNGCTNADDYVKSFNKLSFSKNAPATYDYVMDIDEDRTGSIKLYFSGRELIFVSNDTMTINDFDNIKFAGVSNISYTDLLSTSNCTNLASFYFYDSTGDINIDLSFFDTSNVTEFDSSSGGEGMLGQILYKGDSLNLNLSNFVFNTNIDGHFLYHNATTGNHTSYINCSNWTFSKGYTFDMKDFIVDSSATIDNTKLTLDFSGLVSNEHVTNFLYCSSINKAANTKVIIPNKTAIIQDDGTIIYKDNERYKFYYNSNDYTQSNYFVFSYGIKYHLNGGKSNDLKGKVIDGAYNKYVLETEFDGDDNYTIPVSPSIDGKVFDGWYSDPSFTSKVTKISKNDYSTNYVHLYAKYIDSSNPNEGGNNNSSSSDSSSKHIILNTGIN